MAKRMGNGGGNRILSDGGNRALSGREIFRRAAAVAASALLACGLVPTAAFGVPGSEAAPESGSAEAASLESGTYVEHEAIAYVMDGTEAVSPLSRSADALAGAEDLMAVDAEAAETSLGDEENLEGKAADVLGSSRARSVDANEGSMPAGRLVLVRDEAKSTEQLIADLEADSRVLFAEPNYMMELADESAENGNASLSEDIAASSPEEDWPIEDGAVAEQQADQAESRAAGQAAVFGEDADEPAGDLTSLQWGMVNDGKRSGISPEEALDVDYDAWNDSAAAQGLEPVVVAIADSGVDATNPDLAPVMWDEGLDYPELVALGGDAYGISTLEGRTSTDITAEDAAVGNGHGTHVAGIVAAAWNSEGTSGVAPNARIMSVRLKDTLAGTIEGLNYVATAARLGVNVRVMNLSWTTGAGASHSFDAAIAEAGVEGVTSVVASGNSFSDQDAVSSNAASLRDNPYVVEVNAYDESGGLSGFSNYGVATTDVMAPGSAILSTFPVSAPRYLGEEDADAALYESFDEATRVSEGVTADGEPVVDGEPILTFRPMTETPVGEIADAAPRFDGSASYALSYDPALTDGYPAAVQSVPIDLSGLAEKPRYLSIRSLFVPDDPSARGLPIVDVFVRTVDGVGRWCSPLDQFNSQGMSWAGFTVELPEDTDWDRFRFIVEYSGYAITTEGLSMVGSPTPGTVYLDSIGLGSDLVPYAYDQGTSMAAPFATGAACVMAGKHPNDSAAQLAARLQGAVQERSAYDDLCSTGGAVSVDGGDDPEPVPTAARLRGDGTVEVRAFFASGDTQVLVGGTACSVEDRAEQQDGSVLLYATLPAEFAGGQTEVRLVDPATGEGGRLLADLGQVEGADYYDQMNLPVPEELKSWGTWQLVGFAGDIYALPQGNVMDAPGTFDKLLRYDPDNQQWSEVPLPLEELAASGHGSIASVSGTTYRGNLVLQLTDGAVEPLYGNVLTTSYWYYHADGTWEQLDIHLSADEEIGMASLASDGENLYAFGGYGTAGFGADQTRAVAPQDLDAIVRIDVDEGSTSVVGFLQKPRYHPLVAYRDGAFIVSGGGSLGEQGSLVTGVERVTRAQQEGETDSGSEPQEEAWQSVRVDTSSEVTETGQLPFAPVTAEGGFMLVGPQSDAGDADTYTLANADGAQPAAYGKRAASQRLLYAGAVAYDGALYVLGSVSSEPYWVFGATPVRTDPQPGDYVAPEPEPQPEPQPEPDVQPYIDELDGALAGYDEADYTAEGWQQLAAAYEQGAAAIRSAGSDAEAEQALAEALDAMAAVPKADGAGGEVPAGETPTDEGDSSDASDKGSADAPSLKKLATTGDPLGLAAAAAAAVAAAAGGVAVVVARARRSSEGRLTGRVK